ncbi:hypothetical protein [Ponticaulis profundi]|uniref:Uncharacterized protein n=1 Tax=Ponticaulis profundi TaxID=2665222 RepID=A0ABW1SEZ1_9PROT
MTHAPASHITCHAFCAIGLYLARLLGEVARLQTSGMRDAPANITSMVGSANVMVFAFIRSLAATELSSSGYSDAANILRDWHHHHDMAVPLRIDEPHSPTELRRQLEDSMALFERAEVLAHQLACMITCALGHTIPVEPVSPYLLLIELRPVSHSPRTHGPTPDPWPPPDRSSRDA